MTSISDIEITAPILTTRLIGLDLARFLAFFGMVVVHFNLMMVGAEGQGILSEIATGFEGRASALFVILAGIGLGLSGGGRMSRRTTGITLKRALFLLVLGLINLPIFDGDILHEYAFYFLFGTLLLPFGIPVLLGVVLGLNLLFVLLFPVLDYGLARDWDSLAYHGLWTLNGFGKHLIFDGWNPIIPWLGFFVTGMALAHLPLSRRRVQHGLILTGLALIAVAEVAVILLGPGLTGFIGDFGPISTSAIPPTPFYTGAATGIALLVLGLCLRFAQTAVILPLTRLLAPAGRQSLTLYLAHILIGMGVIEALGLDGGQSIEAAWLTVGVFCGLALLYCHLWQIWFKRGPLEAVMRRLAG